MEAAIDQSQFHGFSELVVSMHDFEEDLLCIQLSCPLNVGVHVGNGHGMLTGPGYAFDCRRLDQLATEGLVLRPEFAFNA